MTAYNWKILELTQDAGRVVRVKYFCRASNEKHEVATEGNWTFRKAYDFSENLTENQVASWLEVDAQEANRHLIKTRLDEQLAALENTENRDPPWKVETFKVNL